MILQVNPEPDNPGYWRCIHAASLADAWDPGSLGATQSQPPERGICRILERSFAGGGVQGSGLAVEGFRD